MTIQSGTRRAGPYTTNGVTTAFVFTFKVFEDDDILVTLTTAGVDTEAILTTEYTVALNADQDNNPGGTVTMLTAPNGPVLTITSQMGVEQPAVFTNTGGFYPRVLNDSLDRLTIIQQQQAEVLTRTPVAPVGGGIVGYFPVLNAEGNFSYASGTGVDTALRTDLAAADGYSLVGGLSQVLPLNVLSYAPSLAVAAQIIAGTYDTDIAAAGWLTTAANAAVAQGRKLRFPAGTYTYKTWTPPAGLRTTGDGLLTVFKQLDTVGYSLRMNKINNDSIEWFEGEIVTFNGNTNAVAQVYTAPPADFASLPGRNCTSFNSFVQIYALAGTTINRAVVGSVWAINGGGDIVETGADATGVLNTVKIGRLYGVNIYQSLLSVTAGKFGTVEGIYQMGGLGFYTFNFEPNATSPRTESWYIGAGYGSRFSAVGDPAAPIGKVHIGKLHLDGDAAVYPDSTPAYPYDTVQSQFRGGGYRCVTHLKIDQFTCKNHAYGALWDIGAGADPMVEHLEIGQAEVIACGATYLYNFSIGLRTRKATFGSLLDGTKSAAGIATFLCASALSIIEVNGGRINGHVAITNCLLRLKDMALDGDNGILFREMSGKVELKNCTITDSAAVFTNVTARPLIEDCTITATAFKTGTTPNALVKRSTINTVYTEDGLDTKTVAALPAAAAFAGARFEVTNSNLAAAANFGAVVAAGGAFRVPVYSDGVNWLIA